MPPLGIPLRLGSLRARLLAASAAIILLTLLAAGSAAVWLIQDYRLQIAVDHLRDLAEVAAVSSAQLERQSARPDEIAAFLAERVSLPSAIVLVLDGQGQVLAEQASDAGEPSSQSGVFAGRKLDVPLPGGSRGSSARTVLPGARLVTWATTATVSGRRYILVAGQSPPLSTVVGGPPRSFDRFVPRQPLYRVALAVPDGDLAVAWRELSPGLALAAAAGGTAAAVAAWYLAQSIAQPLRQITRAAERIAHGELRQSIPVGGSDEVAQLGRAFNAMSREVDRSHRMLREFVANASHELRTPLTSIEGFSQAMVDDVLDTPAETAGAARIINEEAQRMRRLVEDLLRLSQVESTAAPRGHAPVDLASLVRDVVRRYRPAAAQRGLELDVDLPPALEIRGDADQLDHLFGNLLENAVKYTPPGGRVAVSGGTVAAGHTGRSDHGGPAGTRATVVVHNSGSFIPADDLPRIFERFYRVDKSRSRGVEGNGLGLAIAHEVAERHGGTITATSDRAAGTSFAVTLPVGQPPAGAAERAHPFAAAAPARGERLPAT